MFVELLTEKERKILKIISLPNRTTKLQSLDLTKPINELCKEACSEDEERDFEMEKEQNVYYVPLLWAADLLNQAHDDGRIKEGHGLSVLIQVCTVAASLNRGGFRDGCREFYFNPTSSQCCTVIEH